MEPDVLYIDKIFHQAQHLQNKTKATPPASQQSYDFHAKSYDTHTSFNNSTTYASNFIHKSHFIIFYTHIWQYN